MKIVEIFRSIEGEGKRAGLPAVFIRIYGCNLECSYCDTKYSCNGSDYREMTINEIVNEVRQIPAIKRVTLTGGEPLIHKDVNALIVELVKFRYEVNVETNGTTKPTLDKVGVFYTMDYKTMSSGMNKKMNMDAIRNLRTVDVLKFVVGNRSDMHEAASVISQLNGDPQIYFSPIFGMIEPKEIAEYLLENGLKDCKVQVQLHKILWDPETRGV